MYSLIEWTHVAMNSDKALRLLPPFPLHVPDMFSEHSFVAYPFQNCPVVLSNVCGPPGDCTYSFSPNSPGWIDSQPAYHQRPTCPQCSAEHFDGNWCSSCGELLLGADHITNRTAIHCAMPLADHVTSSSDERCKGVFSPFVCPSPVHQDHYDTPGAPLDHTPNDATHIVMSPPFTNVPSLIPGFHQVFTAEENGLSFTNDQRCAQLYHLTKLGFPPNIPQMEPLLFDFDKLSLRPCSLTALEDLLPECPLVTWEPKLYSSTIQTDSGASRLGRQRCISGPVNNSSWSKTYGFRSDQLTLDSISAAGQTVGPASFTPISSSPPSHQFSTSVQNNWWPTNQGLGRVHSPDSFHLHFNGMQETIGASQGMCSRPTSCSFSQIKNFTRARRKARHHSHRLKCLSECPRTLSGTPGTLTNGTVSLPNASSSIVDSDSHPRVRHAMVTTTSPGNNQSFCSWPSRSNFPTQDLFIAKTKSFAFHHTPFPNGFISPTPSRTNQKLHSAVSEHKRPDNQIRRKNPTDRQKDHRLISSHSEDVTFKQAAVCSSYPIREHFQTSDSKGIVGYTASTTKRIESSSSHPSHIEDEASQPTTAEPTSSLNAPSWLRLPDELWLLIIRSLPIADRAHLALVCRRLSVLVVDRSLWRVIQLNRHQHLNSSALISIGRLQPHELHLYYCHGNTITGESLRQLFEACGSELRKLSFVGCTKGLFDGDLTLLLAAEHCPNLSHIDASYTQSVRDHTVITLARSLPRLTSLKLNGARQISNFAIGQLVRYRESTLQRLELFGCFRLNSDIFALLGRCQQLRALAFGHLYHLSSDGLLELVSKLPLLASLDLRGTQALASDSNLARLADKCPHLEEVVLANMRSLKHEAGIAQMLRRLPRLRVLDLCGLAAVGDLTMEALATCCPYLEELDVSCTSVTHIGLSYLIETPAKCLRCLRISRCRDITEDVLEKLVQACSSLTQLYAYDFKSIKDWSFLQKLRPTILIESDC